MNSRNFNEKKKTAERRNDDDEVGELLKAAQDDVLLKLSLNPHVAAHHGSSSYIDPDLNSRFQAFKVRQSNPKPKLDASTVRIDSQKKNPERNLPKFDESDDLFARFAALKGSSLLPLHSSPSAAAAVSGGPSAAAAVSGGYEDDDDGGEDEVEKLMKWAIDAARLDPSPPSDADDDEGGEDDDEQTDDSDDENDVDHPKVDPATKSKRK